MVVPTFHWYDGLVPPFVGVAVKVTALPETLGLVPVVKAIATAGVTAVVKDIVMPVLVAVFGEAHATFSLKKSKRQNDHDEIVYVWLKNNYWIMNNE